MFNKSDLKFLKNKSILLKTVEKQIFNFKNGFPYIQISKAATINNGILEINNTDKVKFIDFYENNLPKDIVKFVPASGAASRMFNSLYAFNKLYQGDDSGYIDFMKSSGLNSVMKLMMKIEKFAFYNDLNELLQQKGKDIKKMIDYMDYAGVIDAILDESGLNYGQLPKGLLKFHNYFGGYSRTAVEEHLVEGVLYCKDNKGKSKIHLTVSPEHKVFFQNKIKEVIKQYEKQFKIDLKISYSIQKPSTDTIAVDIENNPFRNNDGTLLFRPGGHGALIENLNDINADIIFIKNIDNVVPDNLKTETIVYKKIIAGVLLYYQQKIFNYLKELENNQITDNLINEIKLFLEKDLCVLPETREVSISYLKEKLNRPLRVCGMVKNEGEPGGGPFWCINSDKTVSLQIVESSQIDINNKAQLEILKNATHFNPVDIVCAIKDYKGKKFDLKKYVDYKTGFISEKTQDGKKLKAQELPGLWNGAMADWNTIFVEVPIITFNPVKTINDLLRDEHQ